MRKPIIWGYPTSISIEPTTACNLGCTECPSGLKSFTRPTGNLKPQTFDLLLSQIGRQVSYLSFYFQGEPFIHPQFLEFVKKSTTLGIFTVTSTNAHFITPETATKIIESGLHKLIVSFDGTTQTTYENYRVHGELSKVMAGINNLVQAKSQMKSKTPYVELQYLVTRYNEDQIEEAEHITQNLGADGIVFKTAQVYNYKNGNPLIPTKEKYSRYRKNKDGTFSIKNSLDNQCWKMWNSNVITWDGKVIPCCFDKDATHELGNVNQATYKEIWKSQPYQFFRQQILNSRSEIDICTNCSEGTKVFS